MAFTRNEKPIIDRDFKLIFQLGRFYVELSVKSKRYLPGKAQLRSQYQRPCRETSQRAPGRAWQPWPCSKRSKTASWTWWALPVRWLCPCPWVLARAEESSAPCSWWLLRTGSRSLEKMDELLQNSIHWARQLKRCFRHGWQIKTYSFPLACSRASTSEQS